MTDTVQRLNRSLAGSYRLEREVGSGGMATVYVAEDLKHHRQVAVKVLKPSLGEVLGPERFLREIEIAAGLDHPHVLPLYDSGEADGLLYYVMPFVEGESLRDRLDRERQLPVEGALQIAGEVADALSYAHARGVIHRDIKPENILLAEGHARVADFGIAKAITEAGGEQLTRTGVAVGTIAYMSPEQVTASHDLDGRSDLYSLGCVLYEMLAGAPPFAGPDEAVIAQHLTAEPPAVHKARPAVPMDVSAALSRALSKAPADRFNPVAQFADALRPRTAAHTGLVAGPTVRNDPVRAGVAFAIAAGAILAVAYALVHGLGLPDWVLLATEGILVVGLPIVLGASLAEKRSGEAAGGLLTWRNAMLGGALAFGALALTTAVYSGSRALGIGPAGSLLATGALEERDRLILADFDNSTSDPTHGATATELMRIGLSQSRMVSVLDPIQVGHILDMMERDPAQPLTEELAFEAAEREGLKAVITGSISTVGTGFLLSARLVSLDGDVLTAQQERARDEDELVEAVDRLAASLRERFGESLRTIREAPPLDQVTTGSLVALRTFTQGLQAWNQGDNARAMQLMEDAIAIDTTFAMAYRKLAIILSNQSERRSRAVEAATKAYEFRDRLTNRERYLVIAAYHSVVTGNHDQQISAYRTLLDVYPDEHYALNNLGVIYTQLRDYERAAEYYARALAVDSTTRLHYSNLASSLNQLRQHDSAQAIIERFQGRFEGNPEVAISWIIHAATQKDYDRAEDLASSLMSSELGTVFWEATAYEWMGSLDAMRGRMDRATERWERAFDPVSARVPRSPRQTVSPARLRVCRRRRRGARPGAPARLRDAARSRPQRIRRAVGARDPGRDRLHAGPIRGGDRRAEAIRRDQRLRHLRGPLDRALVRRARAAGLRTRVLRVSRGGAVVFDLVRRGPPG
jgi:tetratricopeptide (TPR) repeat protein